MRKQECPSSLRSGLWSQTDGGQVQAPAAGAPHPRYTGHTGLFENQLGARHQSRRQGLAVNKTATDPVLTGLRGFRWERQMTTINRRPQDDLQEPSERGWTGYHEERSWPWVRREN